jgi:long-chain-alcohol oxidase
MGTCRMGSNPKSSVVDPRGECWDVGRLYVADASLFPTASGVNPMVTVEALAYVVANNIGQDLQGSRPRVYSGLGSQAFEW